MIEELLLNLKIDLLNQSIQTAQLKKMQGSQDAVLDFAYLKDQSR